MARLLSILATVFYTLGAILIAGGVGLELGDLLANPPAFHS